LLKCYAEEVANAKNAHELGEEIRTQTV